MAATPAKSATPTPKIINPPLRTVTLAELGAALPIGLVGDGKKLNKQFQLRPFRMKEEKLISEKRASSGVLGRFVSNVLGVLCESFHGDKLAEMGDAEKMLMFSQAWLPDVLYTYVMLRVQALGPVLRVFPTCGGCRKGFSFTADLNTLEVRVVDKAEDIDRRVELQDGIPFRGAVRKLIRTQPPLWHSLEVKSASDVAATRIAMVRSAVVGVEGLSDTEMTPLTDRDMEEMTKRDFEMLTKHIEENTPGPIMRVEAKCPNCGFSGHSVIDWGYDSFFSHSSL